MKVIINLKIGHKNSLVAFKVILVYEIFFWNSICFYETLRVFFAWWVRRLLLLVYQVAFSLFYQGKYFLVHWNCGYSFGESFSFFLGDDTFHRGKLLTDNLITASFSSARQFSSTIFDFPLLSKNCWIFSNYFHLGIVTFEGLPEGNHASLICIFIFVKSFKYLPNFLEYSRHYWSKQSYASFFIYLRLSAIV